MQALYTTLVANLSSKNTNTCKTPFGRAPPAPASLTHSLFMHYSQELFVCLLSPSLTKPVGARELLLSQSQRGRGKLVFWVPLLPLCERRREKKNAPMNSA
jgi:hypothetical protein